MSQRLTHRSSNPAVALRQGVKGRDGGRVAQHYGDLPALGAQRSLTLSAGLWLGHSEQPKLATVHVGYDDHRLSADGKHRVLQSACIALVHGGGNRSGFVVGHGVLRSGPIPPMGESYSVTSDASTPSLKIFSEAA